MTGVVSINHYTRLITLLQYVWFVWFYFRTVRLTNCSLIQHSESHSRETWWSMVIISVIAGTSSSLEMNAVDQWRLRIVYNHWSSGNPDLWHHRSFEGYCENIPQGAVRVELWVGQCSGVTLGDARTVWNSVYWIMIEEVSRPQS